MEMPIEAVLFDYGVVLSGPPDPATWSRMLEISGLDESAFRAAYWGPRHDYDSGFHTGEDYWLTFATIAGIELTATQTTALMDADNVLWTQVNQPMVDWAMRLQAAGTLTGVLSNLGDAMTEGVLARQPWLAGFDHLVWSHALKLAKPDPLIYPHSIEGLGVPAENILFIDDRTNNVDGGIAAGMQAILYTSQPAFEAELRTLGLGELWRTGRMSAK